MIWLYAAAAIAFAAALGYAKIEHSGKLEAQAQVQALGSKIEEQNAAVQQTKADGDRRVAAAQKGVQVATVATAKARSEAQRLRAMQGQPTPAGACPAASAVAEIRKGLQ